MTLVIRQIVWLRIITFLFSGLLFISCSKEYDFTVKNNTKYVLNDVSIDWCNGEKKIFIGSYSTANVALTYKSKLSNSFGSGSLCITVLTYSDTAGIHYNTNGVSIDRSELSKRNPNTISISERSSATNSNIFSIELE